MEYALSFSLNGKPVQVAVKANSSLLDVLRNQLFVTSPKKSCDTGDCGACAVLIDGEAVNSCITLALTVEGKKVTTVEGLGEGNQIHPLQQAFHEHYAAQCGFCTPGVILVAKALLDKNPKPTREEVTQAISGNLCRCTGYVKIIDAIMAVAEANK
ncbi:MAG: (2Fe-2S)-binding protein [Thermodesulfobacteriota bacterium]|nr:(2Fe-2S)-binding protein [Thermodesulfobacteriota bacterium]